MAKNTSSMDSRIQPGTAIGAAPERLGSLGTANIPHTAAARRGIATTRTKRNQPLLIDQPHIPMAAKAVISSKNRRARFIGCDPMLF